MEPLIVRHVVFALVGLLLGSFGNVLVARLPVGRSIGGRSKCPRCGKTIAVRDLIPVLSYLLLRGRCRACGVAIPLRYPLVELGGAGAFVLGSAFHIQLLPALAVAVALWLLVLIVATDVETLGIPDALNFPFVAAGVLAGFLVGADPIPAALFGAAFIAVQWMLGREKVMGSGDILLAAGCGGLLGDWRLLFVAVMIAYMVGGVVAGSLLAVRQVKLESRIAFGPFLATGTLAALVWGDRILAGLGIA